MLQKWHVNCGFSRGAGILPIPSLTNFQNKGGAFKILARINGHISDARPGLILLPDLPPMPIIWPPRVGAVLAAQVRNSGHVIVFSGKIAQIRRPEVARVWGGFLGSRNPRPWPRHSIFWPEHPNPAPRVVRSVTQNEANHVQVWISGSQSSF